MQGPLLSECVLSVLTSIDAWGWETFGVSTAPTPPPSRTKRGRSASPSDASDGGRPKRGRGSRGGKTGRASRARGKAAKAPKPPPLAPAAGGKPGRGGMGTTGTLGCAGPVRDVYFCEDRVATNEILYHAKLTGLTCEVCMATSGGRGRGRGKSRSRAKYAIDDTSSDDAAPGSDARIPSGGSDAHDDAGELEQMPQASQQQELPIKGVDAPKTCVHHIDGAQKRCRLTSCTDTQVNSTAQPCSRTY